MRPILLANSCVNVGDCGHVWVVVAQPIDGPIVNTSGYGSRLIACPSCVPETHLWAKDQPESYMVGGLERALYAHR